MRLDHCFSEELSSNLPEASKCSKSRSLRLLTFRIQQVWTQTSSFGIRIRNSTECYSRFYGQTKRIFSDVIPAVEGLLEEAYAQKGNNSRLIMMVALRVFFCYTFILVPVHFSILSCTVYLFPYLTPWSVEMWLGICLWPCGLNKCHPGRGGSLWESLEHFTWKGNAPF